MNSYPRETDEFVPVTVLVNGLPPVEAIEFSVALKGSRPTTWTPAVASDDLIGFDLENRPEGVYDLYARVPGTPYAPVIDCGSFRVE